MNEKPLVFQSGKNKLFGILHESDVPSSIGVLIIVGGPQTRVGSHRQFVLLARFLAEKNIPVMRFDYQGMGDSEGTLIDFNMVQSDVGIAIDNFVENVDGLQKVVIWGLCDAASLALLYAYKDRRVPGLVLLNPWVRTEKGEAKAYLRHYYLSRMMSLDFWKKVLQGKFNPLQSIKSLTGIFISAIGITSSKVKSMENDDEIPFHLPLPDRMLIGLEKFTGQILLILSGNDMTAAEFKDTVNSSRKWDELLSSDDVSRYDLENANHTFSSKVWRNQVANWTYAWLKNIK